MKGEAQAWIDLFSDPNNENGLAILKEFAAEIAGGISGHKSELKLISSSVAA